MISGEGRRISGDALATHRLSGPLTSSRGKVWGRDGGGKMVAPPLGAKLGSVVRREEVGFEPHFLKKQGMFQCGF
ncbi:hypothetical protein CDAR_571311 [Caerostris darwini]|uniref:Uncharacterized protein n=1 Tax=Caerostris darwini TaxID=1538125 RepID=A0AAV4SL61_9ARAC|nr:hypothetical protein CDAR_571311 [Caerostris darwini]